MASRQVSEESNDFEVLPRAKGKDEQGFMSMNSATEGEGDPYEKRKDILQSKMVLEGLKEKLNFENEEKIDELHEKLKSRDALDAGIYDEVQNLETIANSSEAEEIKETANAAKELVSKVRQLAAEKKTTVKRALDILEVALPVFIHACDLIQEEVDLSGEFAELQDLYQKAKQEMLQYQREFQMEKREEKLIEGRTLLQRSISAATSDRERIFNELIKEKESGNLEKFTTAENDVKLIIGSEINELETWLKKCSIDSTNIESAVEEQNDLHSGATAKFQSRLQSIDVSLEINSGRQADLLRQLDELKKEEERLKNNRVFEIKVQERAADLNTTVLDELASLQKKVKDIQAHASTAEEIMQTMKQCSKILFDKAIEIQKGKAERLTQLQMEALMRERNALSSAAVEFKGQIEMTEDNIQEYNSQVEAIRKDIKKAAQKGQALTVTKKKQELEEYVLEMEKEKKSIIEKTEKYEEMLCRLASVDENLERFGVTSPSIESLLAQRKSELELEFSGPMSLISIGVGR